jgi:hypothetical protein
MSVSFMYRRHGVLESSDADQNESCTTVSKWTLYTVFDPNPLNYFGSETRRQKDVYVIPIAISLYHL